MKKIAKPLAALSAAALLVCSAGCSDTSWSVKTDNKTLSNGAYIYYTYMAYNDAQSKIKEEKSSSKTSESSQTSESSETSTDIMSEKIENKSAEKWMEDKALEYCVEELTINKLLKDNKVKIDENKVDTYKSYYEQWYQYGSSLYNELGVSKETYLTISTVDMLSGELFKSIYGKGGTKEVPSDEIEKYFKENYTDYFYIPYSLKTTDSSGNSVDIDDETLDNVKVNFAKYADMLNNKGKTTSDVVTQYKTDFSTETDPSTSATAVLDDTNLSDDLKKAISGLDDKKATVTTINNTYYLIYKGAIVDKVSTLKEESTSLAVAHKIKDDEYNKYLDEQEEKLKYEKNDACLSRYTVQRTVGIIDDFTSSK